VYRQRKYDAEQQTTGRKPEADNIHGKRAKQAGIADLGRATN
jgi:hypothetical protein